MEGCSPFSNIRRIGTEFNPIENQKINPEKLLIITDNYVIMVLMLDGNS